MFDEESCPEHMPIFSYSHSARGGGKSHMFKSQASLKSQYKQIKQVKSVAHLKQVKSSPDKGQIHVKSQYQTGTNIFLPHNPINFFS